MPIMPAPAEPIEAPATPAIALLPEGTRASQSIAGAARRLFGAVEIPWAKVTLKDQDWRDLLEAIFEDLNRHGQETNTRIVLFWDEFTWFLSDLERKGQPREATTVVPLIFIPRMSR